MIDRSYQEDVKQSKAEIEQQQLLEKEYGLDKQKQIRSWSTNRIPQQQLPAYIKRDPFLWRIFKRLHYEDRNVLIIIVGETGAGKSLTAMNLAKKIDITPLGNEQYRENFVVECDSKGKPTPKTRVVFSASDFMRLVRSGLPKGSCIVWDEAGIGNDNTTWYEKKSKLVKHVMQTFRKQNLMLILTVPDKESVTLATRRLIHIIIDVTERDKNYATCDVRWLQRNRKMDKTYNKTTSYYDDQTGSNTKIISYLFEKIAPEIERTYNKIKDRVLNNLYDFYESEMREMDEIEGFEIEGEEEKEIHIKKFDVVKCVDLCQSSLKDIADEEGNPHRDKIIYFLGVKGYECNTVNARTILANLVEES